MSKGEMNGLDVKFEYQSRWECPKCKCGLFLNDMPSATTICTACKYSGRHHEFMGEPIKLKAKDSDGNEFKIQQSSKMGPIKHK